MHEATGISLQGRAIGLSDRSCMGSYDEHEASHLPRDSLQFSSITSETPATGRTLGDASVQLRLFGAHISNTCHIKPHDQHPSSPISNHRTYEPAGRSHFASELPVHVNCVYDDFQGRISTSPSTDSDSPATVANVSLRGTHRFPAVHSVAASPNICRDEFFELCHPMHAQPQFRQPTPGASGSDLPTHIHARGNSLIPVGGFLNLAGPPSNIDLGNDSHTSSRTMLLDADWAGRSQHTLWTREEDEKLRALIAAHGTTKWALIALKLPNKTNKQCRRRWQAFVNASGNKGAWTAEEDDKLLEGHRLYGNRWTEIARLVPGRTDNAAKNRFAALTSRRSPPSVSRNIPSRSLLQSPTSWACSQPLPQVPLEKTADSCSSQTGVGETPTSSEDSGLKRKLSHSDSEVDCYHSPAPALYAFRARYPLDLNSLPALPNSNTMAWSRVLPEGSEKAKLEKDRTWLSVWRQQAEEQREEEEQQELEGDLRAAWLDLNLMPSQADS